MSSCFSRTVLQHTVFVRQLSSYVERRRTISPEQCPLNSPDFNPVDYKIWATTQQCVYRTKVRNVDKLRQRLLNVWSSIEQDVIDASVDQWPVRLKACSGGRHFEQTCCKFICIADNNQITYVCYFLRSNIMISVVVSDFPQCLYNL